MIKKIGCLHAHHSNIGYIENSFSPFNIELLHFVDPALMYRVNSDNSFRTLDAQKKVKEQLEWIEQCHVDAILITCTNYIAILPEDSLPITVPIIRIDEPYFETICKVQQPQIIVFTNPATVDGTMKRLYEYANKYKKSLDLEVVVLENTFHLIMSGLNEEYNHEIYRFLEQEIKKEQKCISVAQLSMVDAARKLEHDSSKMIINPLDSLVDHMSIHYFASRN